MRSDILCNCGVGDFGYQCPWHQITKFIGPTWGPPGSCRTQMGPMLAPWTLLSGAIRHNSVMTYWSMGKSPPFHMHDVVSSYGNCSILILSRFRYTTRKCYLWTVSKKWLLQLLLIRPRGITGIVNSVQIKLFLFETRLLNLSSTG